MSKYFITRYMVEDVSKIRQRENNSIITPVYILRNLPFNIEVSVFKPNEKVCIFLSRDNQDNI